MGRRRWTVLALVVAAALALLASGIFLIFSPGDTAAPAAPTSSTPTRDASGTTAAPSSLPTPPTPPAASPPGLTSLTVTCNVPGTVRVLNHFNRKEAARGSCTPERRLAWTQLERTTYDLIAHNDELDLDIELQVTLYYSRTEVAIAFPALLEIWAVPEEATIEVDGTAYTGAVSLTYPAPQCPVSVTVWVLAEGYAPYGTILRMEAGQAHRQEVSLEPLPTAPPPPPRTPGPTRPPTSPPPTEPAWTVEERVALVRQKLYEKVNCWRAEAGLGPLPYLSEWQALADDFARAWRDHYLQYGAGGFDPAPWRQQFQAAGGDAVTDNAATVLYAPDYYIYTAPLAKWETFDMCDPNCPKYGMFEIRKPEIDRAAGVVIGIVPWWDGDVLKASLIIGLKW